MFITFLTYGSSAQFLDGLLIKSGDITKIICEDNVLKGNISNNSEIIILEDINAMTSFSFLSDEIINIPVIVFLSSNLVDYVDLPAALPQEKVLILYLDIKASCFSFVARNNSNLFLSRVEQHISICLIRSGLRFIQPGNFSANASSTEIFCPSQRRSFAEMILPVCELGLPCDNCARCH